MTSSFSTSSSSLSPLSSGHQHGFREVAAKRAVNSDEALRAVVVGEIAPRNASDLLAKLSEELPLSIFGLDHLKRIKKCSNNSGSLLLLLHANDSEGVVLPEDIKSLVSNIQVIQAARFVPETREEFQDWGQHWPIVFRPSELNRDRERGMTAEESDSLGCYIDILDRVEENFLKNFGAADHGCIVVNPLNGKVVANSYDGCRYLLGLASSEAEASSTLSSSFVHNPLYTPTMICIEFVAAIVREEIENNDLLGDDHYLCTGLDMYSTIEPDLMSSMGLIHSRIRRVFYRKENEKEGALGTNLNIHDMRELNHRFRVYKIL